VHRVLVVVLLGGLGCGRLSFDAVVSRDAGDDSPDDANVLPLPEAAICHVVMQPAAATPQVADLAIAATPEGYLVGWLDTAASTILQIARIGPAHERIASGSLDYVQGNALGGMIDVGDVLLIATASSAPEVTTIYAVQHNLVGAPEAGRQDQILGRGPFVASAAPIAYGIVFASGGELEVAAAERAGVIAMGTPITVRRPKHELSCSDGGTVGHCVWSQDKDPIATTTECYAADILLGAHPAIGTSQLVSSDCDHPRIALGDNDSPIEVWQTPSGGIQALYQRGTATVRDITTAGTAPKVVFDGQRFWVGWLAPDGGIVLTALERTGVRTDFAVASAKPRGPEAFQLVHRSGDTVLAVLGDNELDLLTVCPP
jgi:hypothetical protein